MQTTDTNSENLIRNHGWHNIEFYSSEFSISKRAIRMWIEDDKIPDKHLRKLPSPGRKGFTYEIQFLGVPEPYRSQYIKDNFEPEDDLVQQEIDALAYAKAPGYAKEHAQLWLKLIQQFGELKGADLKAAINAYRDSHPDQKVSWQTFYKKKKVYDEQGIAGLLPDWGNRKGETKIDKGDFELFCSLYLKESRPNYKSCWKKVRGKAFKEREIDPETYPKARTFLYQLEQQHNESFIYFCRYGKDKWNRKYGDFVDRDKSDIPPNNCWVGDHRVLDILVINQETNKVFRPWCTAWMDFRTNKFLEVHLYEGDPNSDRIIQSFKWAIEKYGRPHDSLYIDNGRDYKSNDFANPELDEDHTRSIVSMLGISAHFAIPYNAQSKNIEPAFKRWIENVEKHYPGYTGANSKDRPEDTIKRVKRGDLIEFEEFKSLFTTWIYEVYNKTASQGKELQGRSPDELFYSDYQKIAVRPQALRLMCMRTSNAVSIGRNGINDSQLGKKYYAEWMMAFKGRKVYMRRDIKSYQEAWVFDAETNEFLGNAYLADTINGLVSNDVEREKLREFQKRKRKEQKILKAQRQQLSQPSPQEMLTYDIYNVKAETEIRKLKDEFEDYAEQGQVIEMDTNRADDIIHSAEQKKKTGTEDLEEFVPDEPKVNKPLKSIWDND